MKSAADLEQLLQSLDGQQYSAYKRIKGIYKYDQYQLAVDHIQVDPFAPPSKVRIMMNRETAGIPDEWLDSKNKMIAVADFLTRTFWNGIQQWNKAGQGTGKSGMILIDRCGQEMLERTSVLIKEDRLEVRLEIGLPAAGRRILGKAATRIFKEILPRIVKQALLYRNVNQEAMINQVILMLDQVYIREQLERRKLVAFVANGSVLPRESGVSDKPLKGGIPFVTPKKFEMRIELPSGRTITGMGIPEGITLIVGGGYHGKSTLLQALELGVYHHIAGDGREMVITRQDAVKILAEDGRNIEKVNISPFINNLPGKKNTRQFSTENASGSTSQAANVMEALEAKASLLLIDEDTSATNFMIRDGRMQKLIAPDKEPITPFIDKVKPLFDEVGVSTILIIGGSGDYFDVADHIIMMDEYQLKDVTDAAKTIASTDGYKRENIWNHSFGDISARIPLKTSFSRTGKENRLKAKGRHTILYGKEQIDLSGLEQLIDDSQTNCIAVMLDFFKKELLDEKLTISEAADRIYTHIEQSGLDSISPYTGHPGNLALPRKIEFCSALNRYRGLRIKT